QRLLAEQSRPRADVFWNGEFMQTIALKRRGALASYASPARAGIQPAWLDTEGYWTGLGARLRVLLVNTEQIAPGLVPASLDAIAGPRAGIAYPLFGTAASHAAALYASLGPAPARAWFERLRTTQVRVVDGNSVVRDLVAAGQLAVGLTDSDDACGAVGRGAPVRIVVPDGAMVIPGTVALVRGAPHAAGARLLIDWLLSPRGERRLLDSGFSQMSVRSGRIEAACPSPGAVRAMTVPLEQIAAQFERSRADMEALFVR
ncbi:MAG: ABC transporter substrate-binding protein, partial [Acidobacteria bacterium]|nr:ABC transporter substrate-binding protein [Acidobacteriota bacterium]